VTATRKILFPDTLDPAEIEREWRENGAVVVCAVAEAGPCRGGAILSHAPRERLMEALAAVREEAPEAQQMIALGVAHAVREALDGSPRSLEGARGADLLEDLMLLMACRLALGDGVLEGTGLLSLNLAIHPDESLPWERRGMLDPDLATALDMDLGPAAPARAPPHLLH
jgi:hypothetical protein